MNAFIKEICTFLSNNSLNHFTFGSGSTNLKVGELYENTDGTFAIENSSPEPDLYTPVEYHDIDFWSLHPDTSKCIDDLNLVYSTFHQKHDYTTDSYNVYFSHAIGSINDLDRDAQGRKILRLSIRFIIRNLIS